MTIYDIARLAGVSPGTVSRVVNKKPGVKQQTREKIEQLLEEHHYTPDVNARNLVTQNSRMIGILTDDLTTMRLGNVLYAAIRELMKNSYTCLVRYIDREHTMEDGMVELASHRVVGALFMGVSFMDVEKVSASIQSHMPDIPIVMVNQSRDFDISNVYSVGVDERKAFARCVRLFAERGRKHLAILIDQNRISRRIIRGGFEDGVQEADIEGWIYEDVPVSIEDGERIARQIFLEHPEVDGILCAQDTLAIGVLNAAHDANRQVPDDLAIMGEDNSRLCIACRPQLSSLDTIIPVVAITSARVLMDTLNHNPVVHRTILDMEIVERGTT